MSKAPNMKYFFEESIKLRAESFELRIDQNEVFIEANEFGLMSLKAKLKGDNATETTMWENHKIKLDEAISLGEKSRVAYEKANDLMKIYDRGMNWIANKEIG